jgi:LysR family glycine cleavage system transcriptional activator
VSQVRARPIAGAPVRAPWLPPLNSLHAFEAAGRHGSFKNAAAELCVTPSAISRQIKLLEEHLGVPMFVRGATLSLTGAGLRYLEVVQRSFAALATGTAEARAARGSRVVRVTCVQALAASWLVPQLGLLFGRHPALEVQIMTSDALADLAGGEADLAIRFGQGGWPGLISERMLELDAFPVCAPALGPQLRAPPDLLSVAWLHLTSYPRAFRDWLAEVGLADATAERNLSFDSAELVFRAAERGLGVAMATSVLVAPYLDEGRLIRPFVETTQVAGSYFLVARADALADPAVAAVHGFLREVAQATMTRLRAGHSAGRTKTVLARASSASTAAASANGATRAVTSSGRNRR